MLTKFRDQMYNKLERKTQMAITISCMRSNAE